MRLIQFVVCISVLLTKPCRGGLHITSEVDQERIIDATIDILESCYIDRFSTVGLAGPSVKRILTRMSLRDTVIPTTSIVGTSRVKSHHPVNRGLRHKLQVFVITLDNRFSLASTLTQVRESEWWNHMAYVLLIDLSRINSGCGNAARILRRSWRADLLNSKFMCHHETRGPLIYSFNPYTSKAPFPWEQEATYKERDGHIWTLFVREYREDGSHCDRLDFDKARDLGGYEIRASVNGMENWWSADLDVEPHFVNQIQKITAQIFMRSLNATWRLFLESPKKGGTLDAKTGKTYKTKEMLRHGAVDLSFNIVIQDILYEIETTYPLFEDELVIVTHYPGSKSQVDKIIFVLDKSSRFGVIVVFVITLLFFKFWLGRSLITAIMDLVLLICNAGLQRIPQNTAPRIYLTSLFIFVVTIQGIYSSQFASMLTKEVRLPTINTIEDLARSDHIIYGKERWRVIFNQSAFTGRYVVPTSLSDVLKDPRAALVESSIVLLDLAAEYNLHVSRESIGHVYGVYRIRKNWPLEEKFNEVIGQVAASDIVKQQYRRRHDTLKRAIDSYESQEEEPDVKVLTLANLGFAFAILGIGLGLSAITFIIEVTTYHAAIRNFLHRIPD